MRDNIITAKCECGNKVDVPISDHLIQEAHPLKQAITADQIGSCIAFAFISEAVNIPKIIRGYAENYKSSGY